MQNEIRCYNCGKICKETDTHCRYCQEPIIKTDDTYGKPIDGVEIGRWEEFIGEAAASYIAKFRKNDGKKIFVNANIGALIFAQTWMFYRKMYLEAIITYLIAIAIIVACFLIGTVDIFTAIMIMLPLVLAYRVAICIFGDAIYKAYIKREISKNAPDMRKGGTSVAAAIVGSVAFNIILSIISFVFEYVIW